MKIEKGRVFHGDTKGRNGKPTQLYRAWQNMKYRCYDSSYSSYHRYGGRGIRVCHEWKGDYLCFKLWALSNGFKKGLTLDRIQNNKGYNPNNCQWLTMGENSAKSGKRKLTFKQATEIRGSSLTCAELSTLYGLGRRNILRIKNFETYKKNYQHVL